MANRGHEMTQGALANITGNTLEKMVVETLVPKGFVLVPYKDYLRSPDAYGQELLLRQVDYTTLYGHAGKTEFLLRSARYGLDMRIECKWQQSAGSVDEKFPYLYLNCVEAMPEQEIMIIVDGGGAKTGAIDWLKAAAAEGRYMHGQRKTIHVFRLAEFIAWSHKRFRHAVEPETQSLLQPQSQPQPHSKRQFPQPQSQPSSEPQPQPQRQSQSQSQPRPRPRPEDDLPLFRGE